MVYWRDADFTGLAESRSKRDRHAYAKYLVGAFDTETSTAVYEDMKYSWMYIWQFAINDIAVYGRTWDDFREFLLDLRGQLHLNSEYKLIVFVHNLKYDFQFFKNEVSLEGEFLSRDSRTIIKCTVNDCFEFRDSGCYTEEPLYKMGQAIGLHKIDDYDYKKIRHSETILSERELEYCERDVLILTRYYRREAAKYKSVRNIPITATRRVKRLIRERMNEMSAKTVGMIASKRLQISNDHDKKTLELLRKSFFGGFSYSNVFYRNRQTNDVTGLDITSCYPAQALLHKYPVGKFESVPVPENLDALTQDRMYTAKSLLISFKATNVRARYRGVSFLPLYLKNYWSRSKVSQKDMKANRLLHNDKIEMTLTDVDFALFRRFYTFDDVKISGIMGAESGDLPLYIINTIIDLYQKKSCLKARNQQIKETRPLSYEEEEKYDLVKSMLNRIYGIFVQDPIRTEYVFKDGMVQPVGENIADKFDGVLYQWGVWITAWARYELLNLFTAIGINDDKYQNNILHCDTDSIYCIGDVSDIVSRYNSYTRNRVISFCKRYRINPDYLRDIGELTADHYQAFKTVGMKQYGYIDGKGKFDERCAGLPRPKMQNGVNVGMTFFDKFDTAQEKLDAFNADMCIPAEEAKVNQTVYVDNVEGREITIVDYTGIVSTFTVRSFVLLDYEKYDLAKRDLMKWDIIDDERLEYVSKRLM